MAVAPQPEPVTAYIGLGANLGDAAKAVRSAIEAIGRLPHVVLTARSSLYRSAPVDASGPDYINAVIEVETSFAAPRLLAELQAIEQVAGRKRPYRNAPRTLDLDLLLYGTGRIDSPRLTLPHPRMEQRAFVLLPLAEIAPQRVSAQLLAAVTSQIIVRMEPTADL